MQTTDLQGNTAATVAAGVAYHLRCGDQDPSLRRRHNCRTDYLELFNQTAKSHLKAVEVANLDAVKGLPSINDDAFQTKERSYRLQSADVVRFVFGPTAAEGQ